MFKNETAAKAAAAKQPPRGLLAYEAKRYEMDALMALKSQSRISEDQYSTCTQFNEQYIYGPKYRYTALNNPASRQLANTGRVAACDAAAPVITPCVAPAVAPATRVSAGMSIFLCRLLYTDFTSSLCQDCAQRRYLQCL